MLSKGLEEVSDHSHTKFVRENASALSFGRINQLTVTRVYLWRP